MTLTETAQFLGNFGEFLSSIAVLATLVYLTVQIRQTKEQLVHTSQVTRGKAALQIMSSISESTHVAPILAKLGGWSWSDYGLDNDEDTIRFGSWCFAWWRVQEMNYRAYSSDQLETQEQLLMAWLAAWGTPFWPDNRGIFDNDFAAKVDILYERVQEDHQTHSAILSKR